MSADNQQERLKIINPWYITGFTEGEGTFHIALYKDPRMKYGIKIIPEFHINQSFLRKETLLAIERYFGCGYLKRNHADNFKDDTLVYVVRNREDLMKKIIPFFEKFPLISNKGKSFQLFKKIITLMNEGGHSKKSGIIRIIKMAYQMNQQGKYRKKNQDEIIYSLKSSETIRQNSK